MTGTTTEQASPLGGKLIRRTNCCGRGSNVEKINSISQMANCLSVDADLRVESALRASSSDDKLRSGILSQIDMKLS